MQPNNPPPAAADTIAIFAFRKNLRLSIDSEPVASMSGFTYPDSYRANPHLEIEIVPLKLRATIIE
jgi:hypothetical protein